MDLKELALNSAKSRHPWELVRVNVVKQLIQRCFPEKRDLTILDVGSGDTFMIQQLSEYFNEASFLAVDIGYSAEYIKESNEEFERRKRKITVFNELTSAGRTMSGGVDLVLLLDVIEHVPDDVQFLKAIHNGPLTTPQTLFLITVPAFQSLFCSHDVFLGHYRRYNNKLLRENVRKADLQVSRMGYFFLVPLLFRTIEVLLEKMKLRKGNATGIGSWKGNALLTGLLIFVLKVDFFTTSLFGRLGIKLPGLSNFAICKK